jgi:hypothetical protein
MELALNVPVNPVSFGQVSYNLLKVAKAAGHDVFFFPIGDVDLSTVEADPEMKKWLEEAAKKALLSHSRKNRIIKLWHLTNPNKQGANGSYDALSDDQTFMSFYELDSPTPLELNVVRNFDTVFTSRYTCEVFANAGVKTRFAPLAFDRSSFRVTNKKYFADDRIVFCLLGKFENRKHHVKIIKAWTKRFGNNRKYYLQCAIYNPFFNPQMNQNLFRGAMDGKNFFNVNFLQGFVPTNAMYNDFLNSNHIVIGMSGGEGWGLPEFHTIGLGKHGVILNAHAYKDWATRENAVLVSPLNKVPVYDGAFFKEGAPFNQGNIFSFDDDEFIAACEEAVKRYEQSPVNQAGLKLQDSFTYEKTLAALINKD